MKTLKTISVILLATFIFSCSSDDNSTQNQAPDDDSTQNQAPGAFTLIGPEDVATNVIPEFNWNASADPDGETLTYTLFVDTNADPSTIVVDNISATSFTPSIAFAHNETYNWKVQAKDASGNTTNSNTLSFTTKSLNVYVSGHSGNNFGQRAIIWKNGVASPLTDDSRDSETRSIFVAGSDVYVAGYEENGNNVGVAKVWKNGVATILSDGSKLAVAASVFVSGSDVYVAGYEQGNSNDMIAKVWKNGVVTILTNDGVAKAVFVTGNDVYVAGYTEFSSSGPINIATVWKNGVATQLTTGSQSAIATSIFVVGSDVYVGGYQINGSNKAVAKVWKNGVATLLTDGSETAIVTSVFVSGNDVYAAGYQDNISGTFTARIWKNGAVLLDEDIIRSTINSVFVFGNDVYAVGRLGIRATMWKNGEATPLDDGNTETRAYAVYVAEQ